MDVFLLMSGLFFLGGTVQFTMFLIHQPVCHIANM